MLTVENLTVCYGAKQALENVSFRLHPGEWWMVAGPNGAGKSTLAGAVSRALPYSGRIIMDEVDIKKYKSRDFARKVGMLSQTNASMYGFTVEEVVSLGRYAWQGGYLAGGDPEGREKVQEALEITGLAGMERRSMLTLSGGESQRVFLAQVLAQDPRLLILDEPANHLDIPYQLQLFAIIQEWREKPGRAVITVTHDLTAARQYGTHALLMNEGRCVARGETKNTLTPENLERVYGMDIFGFMRDSMKVWE